MVILTNQAGMTRGQQPFDITKDPFAIYGFALLLLVVVLFVLLLTIVSRRSAQEVWNSMRRGHGRTDLEEGSRATMVRVSTHVEAHDYDSLPTRASFDDQYHKQDPGTKIVGAKVKSGQRFSKSDRQLAQLCP